jgi:hypothetical protein
VDGFLSFCRWETLERQKKFKPKRAERQRNVINGAALKSKEMSLAPSLVPGKKMYGIIGNISEP